MALTLDSKLLHEGIRAALFNLRVSLDQRRTMSRKLREGSVLTSESGGVQAGLWAGYPGVNSPNRRGSNILKVTVLDDGTPAIVFTVEERDIPGTHTIDHSLAVVLPQENDDDFMGFGKSFVSVAESAYRQLGVVPNGISHFLGDTTGDYRANLVINALLSQDKAFPNKPALVKWLALLVDVVWYGGSGRLPAEATPSDRAWLCDAYKKMPHIKSEADWWKHEAMSQGISVGTIPQNLAISVHTLPKRMFDVVLGAAEKGWLPVLPMWQTIYGCLYNQGWDRPCQGGVTFFDWLNNKLDPSELKMLCTPAISGYTLHVSESSNQFQYPVPKKWQDIYVKAVEELGRTTVPVNDVPMYEYAMKMAAKQVPFILYGSTGDMTLWHVDGKMDPKLGVARITTKGLGALPDRTLSVYERGELIPNVTRLDAKQMMTMWTTLETNLTVAAQTLRDELTDVPDFVPQTEVFVLGMDPITERTRAI